MAEAVGHVVDIRAFIAANEAQLKAWVAQCAKPGAAARRPGSERRRG
jgi:hypothetical protein